MCTCRWVCVLMRTHSLSYWTHTSHLKIQIRTLRGFRGDTKFWRSIMVTTSSKKLRTNWTRYIIYIYITILRYQTVCGVTSLFVMCKCIEMCVWSRFCCAREFGEMRFARQRRTSRCPTVWSSILIWNAPSGNSTNVILPGISRSQCPSSVCLVVPLVSVCITCCVCLILWTSLAHHVSLLDDLCHYFPLPWSFWGVGLPYLAPSCLIWMFF